MTRLSKLFIRLGAMALAGVVFAQSAPPRISAADAKEHIGATAAVCGKVVSTSIPKYGLSGHGKPVSFYLDQPETKPVFYFLAFGTPPAGPEEVVAAYQGKQVCVTGKIEIVPAGGTPFIMAVDRSQIKPEANSK